MTYPDEHDWSADEPRDPRGCIVLCIMSALFWVAVVAEVWAAGNARGWW